MGKHKPRQQERVPGYSTKQPPEHSAPGPKREHDCDGGNMGSWVISVLVLLKRGRNTGPQWQTS